MPSLYSPATWVDSLSDSFPHATFEFSHSPYEYFLSFNFTWNSIKIFTYYNYAFPFLSAIFIPIQWKHMVSSNIHMGLLLTS